MIANSTVIFKSLSGPSSANYISADLTTSGLEQCPCQSRQELGSRSFIEAVASKSPKAAHSHNP